MTSSTAPALELEDTQGNILRGYGMRYAAYVFLRFETPQHGRDLLGWLADRVTVEHARGWPGGERPDWSVNVALTYQGLCALELPEAVLATFPAEFREGMRARAERVLGDTGPSRPDGWEEGLGDGTAHLLVTYHAGEPEGRDQALTELEERVVRADGAVREVNRQLGQRLDNQEREHFGFTDGFSQPAIEGGPIPMRPGEGIPDGSGGWRPVKAGEFVLGYPDEDDVLPAAPAAPYGLNATFMVFRKLYQDVAGFRTLMSEQARDIGMDVERLTAKVVGRWADGSPLVLTPERPDPAIGNDPDESNAFRYGKDPRGLACPLGAHVRRAHPRDALVGGDERTRRHRLIRRGMPYGPALAEGERDGQDRGLLFICFNASIARQYETAQGWLLDGDVFGLGEESDYLLGRNENPEEGRMTIQGEPPSFLSPQPPLVRTCGGEYLFVPGRRALRALAGLGRSIADVAAPTAASVAQPLAPAPRTWLGRWARRTNSRILFSHPVLALLRHRRPILRTRHAWIVTRHEDVREVLGRHREFTVTYLPRMHDMTGPFILGLDDSDTYRHERAALQDAVRRDDLPHIARWSATRARQTLDRAPGTLDVLADLVDPTIEHVVTRYTGIGWPSASTLLQWSRAIFREVFINVERDPAVARRGKRAAEEMRTYLDAHIAARREVLAAGAARQDHVLDRLLDAPGDGRPTLDGARLRDNLFGLTVAWTVSVSRASALAVDALLRRSRPHAAARRAARRGDELAVAEFLFEALRFQPQADALPRRCPGGATIARGNPRETVIPPGAIVIAVLKSAMRDGRSMQRPWRFSAGRTGDDYLHFGYGLHRCFGEHIARHQMGAIGAALLAHDVRLCGRLKRDGPFPVELEVTVLGPAARVSGG